MSYDEGWSGERGLSVCVKRWWLHVLQRAVTIGRGRSEVEEEERGGSRMGEVGLSAEGLSVCLLVLLCLPALLQLLLHLNAACLVLHEAAEWSCWVAGTGRP